jgi:hypothetical protein
VLLSLSGLAASGLLLRPVPLHLGESLHIDGRLLALVLVWQPFEQLDRMREIMIDRVPRRLEVDAADLGERGRGVGWPLFE